MNAMSEQDKRELESLRRLQVRLQKWASDPTPKDLAGVISSLGNLQKFIREGRE